VRGRGPTITEICLHSCRPLSRPQCDGAHGAASVFGVGRVRKDGGLQRWRISKRWRVKAQLPEGPSQTQTSHHYDRRILCHHRSRSGRGSILIDSRSR
jgi:hypothetical protein